MFIYVSRPSIGEEGDLLEVTGQRNKKGEREGSLSRTRDQVYQKPIFGGTRLKFEKWKNMKERGKEGREGEREKGWREKSYKLKKQLTKHCLIP